MKKYHIISLGCSKNLVDSERFAFIIEKADYFYTNNIEDADTIIINTCGFILEAKEEAVQTILEATEYKKNGNCQQLIVTGCLVKRYIDDLKKSIPEVDNYIDLKDFNSFSKIFAVSNYHQRKILTPSHYAYLRISDGCDNHCSYCAIPAIRGRFKSEPIDKLLTEAKMLADNGVKELIITAQDTTLYGIDLYNEVKLVELIEKIHEIEEIKWIRLLYLHPAHLTNDIIMAFKKFPKLLNYFEIPLQHINNDLLKSMNRHTDKEKIINIIKTIRTEIPDANIRTTFIVGYPGEKEEKFKELKEFIKEIKFDRLGIFTYSQEENTKAFALDDQIDEEIAENRKDELMTIQQQISENLLSERVGKTLDVIIDKISANNSFCYEGRTHFDTPGIDGVVYINNDICEIGNIYKVMINDSWEYDLVGNVQV